MVMAPGRCLRLRPLRARSHPADVKIKQTPPKLPITLMIQTPLDVKPKLRTFNGVDALKTFIFIFMRPALGAFEILTQPEQYYHPCK
jgi:hypothetical protein